MKDADMLDKTLRWARGRKGFVFAVSFMVVIIVLVIVL